MRDSTFFEFAKDHNKLKRILGDHLSLTDYRDFETYMYTRGLYNLLIKIPLFKIFFNHQLAKIARRRRNEMKARESVIKEQQGKIEKQKQSDKFAEKIKI